MFHPWPAIERAFSFLAAYGRFFYVPRRITIATKTQGTELWYLSAPNVMTKVGKVTGLTGTGGPNNKIDTTDLDSTEKESIAGLPDPSAINCPINFTPSLAAHQALYALWQSGAEVPWVVGLSDGTAPPTAASGTITFPTTRTFYQFQGYIADFPIDAAVDSKLETAMTVQRSGPKNAHWKAGS